MKNRAVRIQGVTLIEAMIFSALLSILIVNMISSMSSLYSRNMKLMQDIWREQGGFTATTAVILLAMGMMAFSVVAVSAAAEYSDSIDRRQSRIQRDLNIQACADSLKLIKAKDRFFDREIELADFGCEIGPTGVRLQ